MTEHVVLLPFAWAADGSGIRAELVVAGDVRDFRDMAPGLLAEGYIAAAGGPPTPVDSTPPVAEDAVAIPDDWRELSWPAKRKLAAAVSDSPIRNGDDADAAIETYLNR